MGDVPVRVRAAARRRRPAPALPAAVAHAEQRLAEARDSDLARLMEQAFAASMAGRDLLAELRQDAEAALARQRASATGGAGRVDDQARPARADHPGRCEPRGVDATIGGPRTWMSWLLLAVFVALAVPRPPRCGARRSSARTTRRSPRRRRRSARR